MNDSTPKFVRRVEQLKKVGRVEWRPSEKPDPGNPNNQPFDALFLTPPEEGPSYSKDVLESMLNAVTEELSKHDFQIDTTVYFDDGVEIRQES